MIRAHFEYAHEEKGVALAVEEPEYLLDGVAEVAALIERAQAEHEVYWSVLFVAATRPRPPRRFEPAPRVPAAIWHKAEAALRRGNQIQLMGMAAGIPVQIKARRIR